MWLRIRRITIIEARKILKKKSIWVLVSLLIVFQALLTLFGIGLTGGTALDNGYQISALSVKVSLQFIVLFILVVSLKSISDEVSYGTIKIMLSNSVLRQDVVLSKFLAVCLLSWILVVTVGVVGLVLGGFSAGMSDLKEGEYIIFSSFFLLKNYFYTIILTLLSLPPLVAYSILFSAVIRNPGASVGFGIAIYFLLQVFSESYSIEEYSFTYYIFRPVGEYYRIAHGELHNLLTDLIHLIVSSSFYVVIFIVLAVYLVKRIDFWD